MRQYLNTTSRLESFHVLGTLVLFPLTFSVTWVKPAVAQIVPDGTLGVESSIVTPLDTLRDQIDGGAVRGSNLFHSFQDFNIDDGRGAFFSNPTGIENILTRITGGNPSNILGTLGVSGNANLFLINPNGIVFGPNARLDVGGSFFASTAEGITFLDGYQFSATNPDVPPLLTINVPIGLQFGANPGGIVNQSVATNEAGEVRGLEVPLGENLALVGGNVTLDGGSIQARGGRAELGGLAGVGTVGVNADASLSFPEGVERADVSLANDAEVNVRAGGGGEISIRVRNFEMSGISKLRAGIADGMGVPESQAGDINIDATGAVALFDGSFVSNAVLERAIGNGGDVNVTSQTLSLLGDAERFAEINTLTEGEGNAGVVTIRTADTMTVNGGFIDSQVLENGIGNVGGVDIAARNLAMTDDAEISSNTSGYGNSGLVKIQVADTITLDASRILNRVVEGGVGNAADIDITTGALFLSSGATISAGSFGMGDSGSVKIQARDAITLDDSNIFNQISGNAIGNSGEININTVSLFLNNGAQVSTGNFSRVNAGDIRINAADSVSIDGFTTSPDGTVFFSGITASVEEEAIGNGGNIDLSANLLSLSNGGFLDSSTSGQGDAGRISISADTVMLDSRSNIQSQVTSRGIGNSGGVEIVTGDLFINNGAFITAATFGQGNAGKIEILAADTVSVDGFTTSSDGMVLFSGITSDVHEGAIGNGSDIEISADSVYFSNEAFLSVSTFGWGDAGKISIHAETVTFENNSEAFSLIMPTGVGNSSGIEIITGSLFINDGVSLTANALGQGNAGMIKIQATDAVILNGIDSTNAADQSNITTQVGMGAVGNSQGIEITTTSLILRNSLLAASTFGQGDAGKITIQSDNIVLDNTIIGSTIENGATGRSQGIDIITRSLSASNSVGGIGASTSGNGSAGDVSIRATDVVSLNNTNILSSVGLTGMGDGGEIAITTRNLSLHDSGLLANTLGQGNAGNIVVRVTDSVMVTGSLGFATSVSDQAIGQGGNVNIETSHLFLGRGTGVFANTDGRGDAGQVTIRDADTVTLDGSFISANAFSNAVGNARGIDITTDRLSLINEASINAATSGRGDAGQVVIRATDAVTLDNGEISSSAFSSAVGNARGVEITTNNLSLSNGASIDAVSDNSNGNAGKIELEANRIDLDRSFINASTLGGEGNINLRSQELVLRNNSRIRTDAFGTATGGNITLNSDVIAALENSDISANAQDAFGGRVTIDTQGLFGTAFRERLTPQSDITATSALGPDFSGIVEITPPEVDPASGLVSLPESPVDADSLFGKDFCSQRGTSQFIFTGRGGIPPSPYDPLGGSSPIEIDWVEAVDSPEVEEPESRRETPSPVVRPLIEAQGWVVAADGTIVLTAQPHRGTPAPPALSHPDCQTFH